MRITGKSTKAPSSHLWEAFLVAAVVLLSTAIFVQIDVFELLVEETRRHKDWELDEIFSGLIPLSIGLIYWSLRRWYEIKSQYRKLTAAEQALRESETQIEAIVNNVPYGLALKDKAGKIIFLNRELEKLRRPKSGNSLGDSRGDSRGGHPNGDPDDGGKNRVQDIFPKDFANALIAQDLEVFQTRAAVQREHRLITGDDLRILRVTAFPVLDRDNVFSGIGMVTVDVTDQALLEDRLQQSQKMEAIGRIAGGVAHEFNNMLMSISGNAELLREALEEDLIKCRQVETIMKASLRGAHLTQQLLTYSRQQTLAPKRIDVNAQIQEAETMLRPALGETVTLKVTAEKGLWTAKADPGRLHDALLNLALNARDAMPGGGTVTIETANRYMDDTEDFAALNLKPGDYVMLAISDTGQGITPEVLGRVFDPFFTTKEVGQGTGLGLSMVQGFAQQSGGQVRILSSSGTGTTVQIYLPRSVKAPAKKAPEVPVAPIQGSERILVVEDDAEIRDLVSRLLSDLGYQIQVAGTGEEALAILRGSPEIDLLFTDIIMPGGISGWSLAKQASQRLPGLKVLFTSGHNAESASADTDSSPGKILLKKPYRKRDLAEAVHRVLN